MKLLGLTINNKLNFGIHKIIYAKWLLQKSGSERIRNRLNLSRAKISLFCLTSNIVALSWYSVEKTLKNKTYQIQKLTLRIVYSKPNLNLDKLVELDKSTTIHIKTIITLLTEVYKAARWKNPVFMNKVFTQGTNTTFG